MRCDGAMLNWRTCTVGVGILALVLAVGSELGFAGLKKSDSEVKIAASSTRPDASGRQTVTLQLAINKGWHLYANPIRNDQFTSLETKVSITSQGKPVEAKVSYPAGKRHQDKIVGDYMVYENKIAIQADVQRGAGDNGPLEVSIRFNACNDKGQCLQPATVKVSVPAQ